MENNHKRSFLMSIQSSFPSLIQKCSAHNNDESNSGGDFVANNRTLVPQAKQALNKFKYEVASEVGVSLNEGYNGDIKARDAGKVGGNMVKKMIEFAEQSISGK